MWTYTCNGVTTIRHHSLDSILSSMWMHRGIGAGNPDLCSSEHELVCDNDLCEIKNCDLVFSTYVSGPNERRAKLMNCTIRDCAESKNEQ